MNKVDKLSLTRDQILEQIQTLTCLEQVYEKLFHCKGKFNTRLRNLLNRKYGIDITAITTENRNREILKRQKDRLDQIFICDNCGKEYRNGDHLCANKSGHHFCSDMCSHQFSANANKDERRRKTSETLRKYLNDHKLKHRIIKCKRCGTEIEVGFTVRQKICDKCVRELSSSDNLTDLCGTGRGRGRKKIDNQKKFFPSARYKKCVICGNERGQCKRPDICQLSIQAFGNFIKCLGFDKTAIGTERVYDEFDRVKNWLNDLYWNKNMSIPEITALTGYQYGDKNFIKILRRFIPLRTVKQGFRLSCETKHCQIKDIRFESGFHTTWDGKQVLCRSSYEFDLCKQLDEGMIPYEVESMVIDYYDTEMKKTRMAIPDFYLPEQDLIIEVKSSFTFVRQNMIDRAKAFADAGYGFLLEYEHKTYTYQEMLQSVFGLERNIKTCSISVKAKA